MIIDEFDPITLANMEEALDRASRQFPAKLSDHESRKEVACKVMDTAKQGQTTLQPLAEAAASAASELAGRDELPVRTDRSVETEYDLPVAGPHARPELTDYDKTPGCGMLPNEADPNPSPTG
jgi:hypothetical protein